MMSNATPLTISHSSLTAGLMCDHWAMTGSNDGQVNAGSARFCAYSGEMTEWTPAELRAALDEHNWTNRELAERIGISRRTVGAWLAGENAVSRSNARALTRAFTEAEQSERAEPEQRELRAVPAVPDRRLSDGALWAAIDDLMAEAKRRYWAAVDAEQPRHGVTMDVPDHVLNGPVPRNASVAETAGKPAKRAKS